MLALVRLPARPAGRPGQLHAVMGETEHFEDAVLRDTVEQHMPRVSDALCRREQSCGVPEVQRAYAGHTPYRL